MLSIKLTDPKSVESVYHEGISYVKNYKSPISETNNYCSVFFAGLWTSDANNSAALLEIGRKLKERLRIPQKVNIGYQIHKDTMDKSGSVTKNTYTV